MYRPSYQDYMTEEEFDASLQRAMQNLSSEEPLAELLAKARMRLGNTELEDMKDEGTSRK